MFSKIAIAGLVAVSMISANPVLATGKNTERGATSVKDQTEAGAKTRYCARAEAVTGSIRQGRICKTASQWREEGVDVSKMQPRN